MKCLSYDGVLFADLNVTAGVDPLTDRGPYRAPIVLRRPGTSPVHAGVDQDAAVTSVTFVVKPGAATEATLLALLGALDPENDEERPFVGLLEDDVTQISRDMAVASWRFSGTKQLVVDFSAADPTWRATSDTTATPGTDNAIADSNPGFDTDITTGWVTDLSGGGGTAWQWDNADYHTGPGALRVDKTTVPAGGIDSRRRSGYVLADEGETVVIGHWCKTSNVNLVPLLRIQPFSGGGSVPIVSVNEADWVPTANTWTHRTLTYVLPATTGRFKISATTKNTSAGTVNGTVRFDDYSITFPNRIGLPNSGQATARPTVEIAWSAQRTDDTADVGWKYRKSLTITNNGSQPIAARPWRVSLGSTTALVSGSKALSSGDDVRWLDPHGVELRRTLITWNTGASYLWFLLDLQPGEAKTFALIYGNPSATAPDTLTGIHRPVFDVDTSDNTTWKYLVAQTSRGSDWERGLWYLNKRTVEPTSVRYDAPGSWRPFLYLDNRDDKAQDPYTMADIGGGDLDPFAILRAHRTWSGGGGSDWDGMSEADGVAFSNALPIAHIKIDYKWYNPNGLGKFLIAQKEAGAEKWAEVFSRTTVRASLTSEADVDVDLVDGPRHLYLGIVPEDAGEVSLARKGDNGTSTTGSTTTVADSGALWDTDEWVGASVSVTRISDGAFVKSTVVSNTPTVLTVSPAFTRVVLDDERYVIQFRSGIPFAEAQSDTVCEITFDTTDVSVGSLGGEASVYDLNVLLRLDGDFDATDYPYHTIAIGYAGTGRRLLLSTNQRLVIDGERMRADRFTNTTWNNAVPWAVDVRTVDEDAVTGAETDRLAEDWLPIAPGDHTLYVTEDAMGTLDIDASFRAGYLL
jgi:hypothetical protein